MPNRRFRNKSNAPSSKGTVSNKRSKRQPTHSLRMPYVAYVPYGKSVDISLAQLMNNDALFAGVPWRLRSAMFEGVVINSTQSGQAQTSFPPAFLQVALNNAESANVEAIVSTRFMVTQQSPRRRVLRMKSPNTWKEDEQRSQALITCTNLTFGAYPSTIIAVHIEALIQFGQFTLDNPSALPNNLSNSIVLPASLDDYVHDDT